MSDSKLDRQLGELPSPRSPAHLDDKILSYAKEHAPARRVWLQPAWATGIAAVAITGVAVFITVPQQPVPATLEVQKEVMAPAETTAPVAAEAKMENRAMMKMSRREELADQAARRRPEPSAGVIGGAMEMEEMASFDSAMDREAPALAAAMPQTEDDVQTVLQQCREWVDGGEIEKAEALYRDLRERCSDCGLPETLGEALEVFDAP